MATMNISLPDQMKQWVEDRTLGGRYANSSEVIRELIRLEQSRQDKIANMQRLIDEARASGISDKTPRQIFAEVKAEHERRQPTA